MIITDTQTLAQYRRAAQVSTSILEELRLAIKIGVTPLAIDRLADRLCQQHQVKPNFKGVGSRKNQYQHATCISVNDTVVHGIPDDRPFQLGDIVKVDFGINDGGLNTDHCFTVGVGQLTAADEQLVLVSKKAIQKAARLAVTGNTIGDLSHAMQKTVERAGFNVIKEFVGHGIGRTLHEDPQIPAFGKPHRGQRLTTGMVLCVEAQIVAGSDEIYLADDGWTIKTADGQKAAMFEYMVVVNPDQPIFLTPTLHWPIIN